MHDADGDLAVEALRARAQALAGGLADLPQRASVYHHLFAHSGANHTFPLLAAHGALWASGYFRAGIRFGSLVATAEDLRGRKGQELKRRLLIFADDFRDINRRVCAETYFIYYLTADPSLRSHARSLVPPELLSEMERCHSAKQDGRVLSEKDRKRVFSAFFLWEQAQIVGPSIERAFAEFDWPLIKKMALKPKIRFCYFSALSPLVFKNFADTNERIAHGLSAFDRACQAGWPRVERALSNYGILPSRFLSSPEQVFFELTSTVPSSTPTRVGC